MKKPWLTCEQFAHLSALKLEANPTPTQRIAMWLHLQICGPCNHHEHQLQQTVSLLHDLKPPAPEPVPDDKKAALLSAFRAAKQP